MAKITAVLWPFMAAFVICIVFFRPGGNETKTSTIWIPKDVQIFDYGSFGSLNENGLFMNEPFTVEGSTYRVSFEEFQKLDLVEPVILVRRDSTEDLRLFYLGKPRIANSVADNYETVITVADQGFGQYISGYQIDKESQTITAYLRTTYVLGKEMPPLIVYIVAAGGAIIVALLCYFEFVRKKVG